MALERVTSTKTLKQLHKDFAAGKLNFDLAIQRKNNVWDIERKSLLIHSILYGYPIPPIFSVEFNGNLYNFIDGKQRLTSLFQFMNNEFQLSDNTPDIDDQEISELTFDELPEDLQDKLKDYSFSIPIFKSITDDEIEEMFIRLNSGVPLSKIELTRVFAGTEIMSFVQEITAQPFFTERTSLTDNMKNRFVDEELVLQIIALIMNEGQPIDLGSAEIKSFVLSIKEDGIPEEVQDQIKQVTNYFNEAFPVKEKFLSKTHIPMLFLMAQKAIENQITAVKFAGWAKDFLVTRRKSGNDYFRGCTTSTAKKDNVTKRINAMTTDFYNNINNSPDYILPAPKQPGQRGRKKKVEETAQVEEYQAEPITAAEPEQQEVFVITEQQEILAEQHEPVLQ